MKNIKIISVLAFLVIFGNVPNIFCQWVKINGPVEGPVNCFAVTDTFLFAGTENGGVYRSNDNGKNWEAVNYGLPDTTIYSFAVNGNNLFVGTWTSGVFLSSNNGLSWKAAGLAENQINTLTSNGTDLFAGTFANGVFLSTDSGMTWKSLNNGFSKPYVLSLAASGTNIFAGIFGGGVDYSIDNGERWNHAYDVPCSVPTLAISNNNWYAGTYCEGVFLSTNKGENWKAIDSGLTNHLVQALLRSGTDLFAGTWGGGVFLLSDNTSSWKEVNTGLTNTSILSLAIFGSNLFAAVSGGDIWQRPLSDFGINAIKEEPEGHFFLSPNPTTGIITIHNTSSYIRHISITNILGESVLELTPPDATEFIIDLSQVLTGTYFARFSLEKEEFIRDIIKE